MKGRKKSQIWRLDEGKITVISRNNQVVDKGADSKGQIFRGLGIVSELGFVISIPIVAGVFIGLWLDKKFTSYPVLTLSLLFLGLIIAFMNLFMIINDFSKKSR